MTEVRSSEPSNSASAKSFVAGNASVLDRLWRCSEKMHNKSTILPPLPGRPPPADDDERDPAPASSPNPSDPDTRAWCFSTTRAVWNPPTASPVGNDRGLRQAQRSPTARSHVSEGIPDVSTDDRDFVVELNDSLSQSKLHALLDISLFASNVTTPDRMAVPRKYGVVHLRRDRLAPYRT